MKLTRVFDAPRSLVFTCWSQPDKLLQWSGCKEATRCEIEMDFRVGGRFTQKMHIAGKGEFTITGTYDDIVVPEKISYRALMGQTVTHVLVEFFEHGGQTKVVLSHTGFPDETSGRFVSEGTTESFDKLDSILEKQIA